MQKQITVLLAACLALGVVVTAAFADRCSGHGHGTGSILGAVGGGLIGNAITHGSGVGIVGGAVAGGLAGNAIARDIDCKRGRHYDRHVRGYYYYDRHGRRVYEDREGRLYRRGEDRDHYRDRDYDR
jgi:uncharacterized protein YcfJ